MAEESHQALSDLQSQLEDYKEKSRKEISDSQKQAKDRNVEVEKMQYELGRSQDEVGRKDLSFSFSLSLICISPLCPSLSISPPPLV